jgi:hypothetical protein
VLLPDGVEEVDDAPVPAAARQRAPRAVVDGEALEALAAADLGVRPHRRFRNRGTEYDQ